jgi:O-antigen/teichoic acid export membrane protein
VNRRRSLGIAALSRDTALLVASRVAAQLAAVGLTVLLAGRLGLVGFGEFAFVSALVFVANVVTTFGTDMVLIRDVAGLGRMDRCAPAFALQIALSLAVITVIWLATAVLPPGHGEIVLSLRIMSLSLLPSALFSVCTAALRGRGALRAYAAITVGAAATPLLAVAVLAAPGVSVVRAVTLLLVAQGVIAAVAWATSAARVPDAPVISRTSAAEVMALARASASIGVLGLLGVAYQRCGALAVAIAAGPAATGWFAGASRVVEASKTGHVALFTAVYPAMAEAHADGRSNRLALRWSWRMSVAAGALVSATLLLAGPWLIDRLYGAAFASAKPGLAILALTIVPSTVATYQSLALLAADRARDTLRVLASSLAILLVSTVLLVPTVGWIGACWAALIADSANAALMLAARAHSARRPAPAQHHAGLTTAAKAGGRSA